MAKKKKNVTVGIIYNEPSPELYGTKSNTSEGDLKFVPYFEVENQTPMDEFDDMVKIIKKAGYNCYAFNMQDNLDKLLEHLYTVKPDIIFNQVEIFGISSRYEMNIAGIYEMMRLHYTGAPVITLANCQDKVLTKKILRSAGIRVADFEVVTEMITKLPGHLSYPVIIKPAYEDASVGIEYNAVVRDDQRLKDRISYILDQFKQPAIVEQFIEGRELNISVVGHRKPEVLPISEIDFTEMPDHLDNIVSYQAKWDPAHESYHRTIPICPAELPKNIEHRAKKIALKAFKTMNCRDYARVDCRLNKNGEVFVLEVNPNPDLTEGAGFMRSADAAGYSYSKMLEKIIESAIKRKERNY